MKDLFSDNSAAYAQFRPQYPDELFRFIYNKTPGFEAAWDVGTGNGQVATILADQFARILATDISEKQLAEANPKPNIKYRKQSAEAAFIEPSCFDLIITSQALHWFDFTSFYDQVYLHLKSDGLFVAVGYGLIQCQEPQLDNAINHLYYQLLKDYWDPERKHIDKAYQSIPFPFSEIQCPTNLTIREQWSPARLCAYLGTWSAVQHYRTRTGADPLAEILALSKQLGEETPYNCHFPVFLRAGYLNGNANK